MFFKTAPEFSGLGGWINSKPLSIKGLRGKVVLLDFWTYSCVNCLRTLPHLEKIHEKYKKYGLVLIGVHTPEFEFEKERENVETAVKKHKIKYPVALDSDNITWKLYGNRFWPRQALIDHKGNVVWEHSGEGGYEEMEEWIQKLLKISGREVDEKIEPDKWRSVFRDFGVTPELYAGSERGQLGSSGVCLPNGVCKYVDGGENRRDVIYPDGEWTQTREFLTFTGKQGFLKLKFRGSEINCVIDGKGELEFLIDGRKKTIRLNGPDMYQLGTFKGTIEPELKIFPKGRISIYAFTFG